MGIVPYQDGKGPNMEIELNDFVKKESYISRKPARTAS